VQDTESTTDGGQHVGVFGGGQLRVEIHSNGSGSVPNGDALAAAVFNETEAVFTRQELSFPRLSSFSLRFYRNIQIYC
jgi:hypothetical protein